MEATVTSRRPHVATSPRRDVSSRSEPYHLKYGWLRLERGGSRGYEERHGFPEQSDTDFEGVPGIVPLFIFFGYFRILA